MAILLFGGGFLLDSAATVRLMTITVGETATQNVSQRVRGEIALATSGVPMMAGLAVLILGILSVVGFDSVQLTLVAAIVGSAPLVANTTSLPARFTGMPL